MKSIGVKDNGGYLTLLVPIPLEFSIQPNDKIKISGSYVNDTFTVMAITNRMQYLEIDTDGWFIPEDILTIEKVVQSNEMDDLIVDNTIEPTPSSNPEPNSNNNKKMVFTPAKIIGALLVIIVLFILTNKN